MRYCLVNGDRHAQAWVRNRCWELIIINTDRFCTEIALQSFEPLLPFKDAFMGMLYATKTNKNFNQKINMQNTSTYFCRGFSVYLWFQLKMSKECLQLKKKPLCELPFFQLTNTQEMPRTRRHRRAVLFSTEKISISQFVFYSRFLSGRYYHSPQPFSLTLQGIQFSATASDTLNAEYIPLCLAASVTHVTIYQLTGCDSLS